MKKKEKKAPPRKSYEAPKLSSHGRFKDMTKAKGGTKGDGAGKPASRINGGQA